jgi:hypothetical protein
MKAVAAVLLGVFALLSPMLASAHRYEDRRVVVRTHVVHAPITRASYSPILGFSPQRLRVRSYAPLRVCPQHRLTRVRVVRYR